MSQADNEENTLRALKDLPLIMTRFRCRLGMHKWTQWSNPFVLKKFPEDDYLQGRLCVHCNSVQTREISLRQFAYFQNLLKNNS